MNEIKWTIVIAAEHGLEIFTRCISRLVRAIDPSRTEIIVVHPTVSYPVGAVTDHYCRAEKVARWDVIAVDGVSTTVALYNRGGRSANGQQVLFLSDKAIVTLNLLVKLSYGYDTFERDYKVGKIGICAPLISKAVADTVITQDNLDDVQANIDRNNTQERKAWQPALGLGKACLFMGKHVFDAVGGFDETFDIGFAAIEVFTAKVLQLGYLPVIAPNTIVYYDLTEKDVGPLSYIKSFYNKDAKPTLAVCYRVKVNSDYSMELLADSIQRSLEFADAVYILDDNSKVKVMPYLKEHRASLASKITHYVKYSRSFDQKRDLNELYKRAEKEGHLWVLFLDQDEIVEAKMSEFKTRLLNPVNPLVFGYRLQTYFKWSSKGWRFDEPWGRSGSVQLVKVIPGREITLPGKLTQQFGFGPSIPLECIRDCSVRILNGGFAKSEEREYRKNFYKNLDVKLPGMPKAGWDYLTSEKYLHLLSWKEDSTFSIYTPLKNGGTYLSKWLDVASAMADEIVLGDNGMSEDDKFLAELYGCKIVPVTMTDDFSATRNALLNHCTKKFILQLDLDEEVTSWAGIRRMLDADDIDAWVVPIHNYQKNGEVINTDTIRMFTNDGKVAYWGYLHETVDNYSAQSHWRVSQSPIGINHLGYLTMTPEQSFTKMQRYMEINIKQMKDNPMDGRAYYNLAIHLLEDNCQEDALRLIKIACTLAPKFPLAAMEMGKTFIEKAFFWMDRARKLFGPHHPNGKLLSQYASTLNKIRPHNIPGAPGHCLQYFHTHPETAKWLKEHIDSMEERIEKIKLAALEQQQKM